MIFADALDIVLKSARQIGRERVGFRHLISRILAEDMVAGYNICRKCRRLHCTAISVIRKINGEGGIRFALSL